MSLYDVFDKAEANAHTFGAASQLRTTTIKAFEYFLVLLRRDAFAMVLDPENNLRFEGCRTAERLRRVLDSAARLPSPMSPRSSRGNV